MAKKNKKILITGGAGYVGSTFIRDALADGYQVRCIDLLVYGGQSLTCFINHPNFEFVHGDIRDRETILKCLDGINIVVHLAAIVGDKPCQAAPKSTYQINYLGTKLLADCSKESDVNKFIFASTCSNYGVSDSNIYATEESSLNPVSLYAETKIDCENYLKSIIDDTFSTTSLRFGTAFGISTRTRFDLTVNSFAYEAWNLNKIIVFAADTWRPYIHVADMSLIIRKILLCDNNLISGEIFNAGSTSENHMKVNIAEILVKLVPGLKTNYINSIEDIRNYKVSFNKLEKLTNFIPSKTIKDGYCELLSSFRDGILNKSSFEANTLEAITDFFGKKEKILSN